MNDLIPTKTETLRRFADNARRLGETENELTVDEMNAIFEGITLYDGVSLPGNARVYFVGTAKSVLDATAFQFESSAVGALSE